MFKSYSHLNAASWLCFLMSRHPLDAHPKIGKNFSPTLGPPAPGERRNVQQISFMMLVVVVATPLPVDIISRQLEMASRIASCNDGSLFKLEALDVEMDELEWLRLKFVCLFIISSKYKIFSVISDDDDDDSTQPHSFMACINLSRDEFSNRRSTGSPFLNLPMLLMQSTGTWTLAAFFRSI